MSGQQAAGSLGVIVRKLVITLVALCAPPTLVIGLCPEVLSSSRVWNAVLLALWGLVFVVLRFVSRVGGAVSEKWVPRLADAVDRTISAVLLGYRGKYLDQLGSSVRDVELLGVATGGPYILQLPQVYVDVSVLPRALHETSGEPFVGKVDASAERRTLASFLGGVDPGVFAVIGGPGSGKTTLLRRTTLDLCQRRFRSQPLPVLLYLRDHVDAIVRPPDAEPTLASVAASPTWMSGKIPANWLEGRLDGERCLVMLDGLDEVAIEDDRKEVVRWVQRQIERYPKNDYVVTSRPHGYRANPLSKANVLQVSRFTGEQISQFIHYWHYAIECWITGKSGDEIRIKSQTKSDDLLSRLRRQPSLYDLGANPLLLTMIANVHRFAGALPGTRAKLYGEMCDMLLHRRQEAKGLPGVRTELSGEQKERVVRELALHMMEKKIRKIPEEEAKRTVGPVLNRVSEKVCASDFLKETVTSGLLVEREEGVYSFVHSTFQEYLAAAEIRERQRTDLLVGSVNNFWWRETTLLWAAGTDASPVIKKCLDLGSMRALELAFDCAEEAREVEPDIREILKCLLVSATTSTEPNAAARRKMITAVRVARSLRDVILLDDGTAVCAKPVARDIYTMFRDEEATRGFYRSLDEPSDVTADDDKTAVGMRASDATCFVDWVNSLFDDRTTYRLPAQDELADNAIGLITDLVKHSVWTQGDTHPRLYCPNGVPYPYMPTMDQVHRFLTTDRQRTSILLSLCCTLRSTRNLDRDLAGDLARDLTLDLDRDLDRDLSRVFDRVFALDFDLTFARDLALARARTVDSALAIDSARALDLDNDRDRHLDLARDLDLDLDLDLDSALDLDRALAIDSALARYLDRARDLARDRARDRARDPDGALARYLDRDRAQDLDRDLYRALDRALVIILTACRTHQPAALSADLNIKKIRVLVLAYVVLVARWNPGNKIFKPQQAIADFDKFLTNIIQERPRMENHVLPVQAIESLQRAKGLLGPDQGQDRPTAELCSLVRRIVHDIYDLVSPILGRTAPHDEGVILCARLGLTSAVAFANHVTGMTEVDSLLREVIYCLTAVQQRIEGGIVSNEVIVLVRA